MSDNRGQGSAKSYAGDISPSEAYVGLKADANAVLVDVRTTAEWSYVGTPDLDQIGRRVIFLEWQRYPDGTRNDQFIEQLREAGVQGSVPVYFLCRSGVRSAAAATAATAAGLGPAFNISDGFEGQLGRDGHRALSGWKAAGLPWRQG